MRVVIQRCNKGSVEVNNEIRKIDKGFVILLGMTNGDSLKEIDYLVKKISNLRIFEDENNKMNYSIQNINGSILLVSQFTLYANTKDGNRPSFTDSMKYDEAIKLYNIFIDKLKDTGIPVTTGEFGEDMKVNIENDGPVTIIIDTKENLYEK